VVLAWIFVIFRYLQAYVHVSADDPRLGDAASNQVRLRRRVLRRLGARARDHVVDLHCRDTDQPVGLTFWI
jgi:predicted deacylase